MNELMLFLTAMSIIGWTLAFWSAVYIVVLERKVRKLKRANSSQVQKRMAELVADEGLKYYGSVSNE